MKRLNKVAQCQTYFELDYDFKNEEKSEQKAIDDFKIQVGNKIIEPVDVSYIANSNYIEVKMEMNNGDEILLESSNNSEDSGCTMSINGESIGSDFRLPLIKSAFTEYSNYVQQKLGL